MTRVGQPRPRSTCPPGWALPIGVGLGGAIGVLVGALLGQIALGLVMGAAIGLVVGTTLSWLRDVPDERRRVVLATAIVSVVAGAALALLVLLS